MSSAKHKMAILHEAMLGLLSRNAIFYKELSSFFDEVVHNAPSVARSF
jgi:hypothetical protein